jgi:hypothetical protein
MKELLIKVLNKLKFIEDREHKLYGLGVDLIEFSSEFNWVTQWLFECMFNDEGFELIYSWLYDGSPKILHYKDCPDSNIEKVEDFVDYLLMPENNYLKDNKNGNK